MARRPAARAAAGEVRLIGGHLKRSRLPVPDLPGLRPTPDRVRETLFNWLGQDLSGWRVLDAFAGTGALGLEAASRGAARVVLLERQAAAVAALRQSVQRLQVQVAEVHQDDALRWMGCAPAASFDLVLLDPPFDGPWQEPAIDRAARLLVPGGWLYVEGPRDAAGPGPGWRGARRLQAGAVTAQLWQRAGHPDPSLPPATLPPTGGPLS